MALLEVRDLRTSFRTDDGLVKAVEGVNFTVERGKTLGIVGESGSGKSVTCLTIMGLNPSNAIISGEALFNGENLLAMSGRKLRDLRGNDIAMIFQDPMTSLNPVHTIGKQLVEAVLLHRDVREGSAPASAGAPESRRDPAAGAAARRLPPPVLRRHAPARDDCHGADQRARPPDRRRADDRARRDGPGPDPRPVHDLQREFGTAIVMITHDLGVVAEIADDVVVMYAGRVAEEGDVDAIFSRPHHPYTWGCWLPAAARRRCGAPRPDPGTAAVAARPAQGLPFPPSLPLSCWTFVGPERAAARASRATRSHLAGLSSRRGRKREAEKHARRRARRGGIGCVPT